MQARADPTSLGLTTEVAGLAVCLLGALAVAGEPELAVALGIATSALLAFKQPIHGLIGKLGEDDLFAGLKLLVATFIVLPVLPDRAIDPWGAINPYKTWLLVILISSLSLVGYVANLAHHVDVGDNDCVHLRRSHAVGQYVIAFVRRVRLAAHDVPAKHVGVH